MITPRQFERYPMPLVDIAQAFEDEIITRLCRELSIDSRIFDELEGQGLTPEEVQRWLQSFTNASQQELENIYSRVYDQVVADEQYLYDYFGRQSMLGDSVTKLNLLRADIMQTQNTFYNYTQTTGFSMNVFDPIAGGFRLNVFVPMRDVYVTALDNTIWAIRAGKPRNLAVKETIRQLTNSGVQTINYESGHRDQIDVAVKRATITGMHNISEKIIKIQQEELGANLTEMSAHLDARDKGAGFVNHKSWQGRVYWVNFPEGNYPSYADVGEGDVQGYRGANCRHSRRVFFEGITEREYTDEQLINIDHAPIEFDGKTYTAYEATQRQRQIERYIRQYKRRIIGYEAAGIDKTDPDYRRTSVILAGWNQYYKDFSAAADLTPQTERAQVVGFGRGEAARARAAARV